MILANIEENSPELLNEYNLFYANINVPGISRLKRGRGFSFITPNGDTIKCSNERKRLTSIAVPPTYLDVWYCPKPNGHIQATGLDASGKKQYFYHAKWEILRNQTKFENLAEFAEKLPAMRRKVADGLRETHKDKKTILSAMLRILDRTGMRIGSDLATKNNKTFGLTTLRKKHVDVDENTIHFDYIGKGNSELEKDLHSPKVAEAILNCAEIPGQRLFEYYEDGKKRNIDSSEINAFIKHQMGQPFSAKDFRTWRCNVLCVEKIISHTKKSDKLTLKTILESVAENTGNTTSILQSSYIHPDLIELIKSNDAKPLLKDHKNISGLSKYENILTGFLSSENRTI